MKLLLSFLIASSISLLAQRPASVKIDQLTSGSAIPQITATTLDGKPFDLAKDYKDQVVLIDFWATWCGPCIAETPNIIRSYEKWKSKGLKVVTVSFDNDPEKAKTYLAKKNMPWTNIADGLAFKSPIATSYGIRGIPQIMLIGRDGRIFGNNLRGDAIGETIERAMTGTGIYSKQNPMDSKLPKEIASLLQQLDTNLASGTEEESLATIKKILAHSPLPYPQLEDIAFRHGCRIDGNIHAQTIYLTADAVMSKGSLNLENYRRAGVARAHAAIELGGPYLVEQTITSMLRLNRTTPPEAINLLVHLAAKDGNTEKALETIYSQTIRGNLRYQQIKSMLTHLKPQNSEKRAILEHWLQKQENLPPNRVTITKQDNKTLISYNVENTAFITAIKLNAMVQINDSSTTVVPMNFSKEKGWHLLIDTPVPVTTIRLHFTDQAAAPDDNLGKYWRINPRSKP